MRLTKAQEKQSRDCLSRLKDLISKDGFSGTAIRQAVSELQEIGDNEVGALLRIAQSLMEVISWEEFCSIYSYALKICTDEYVCAIYAVWISLSEMYWLDLKEMPLKERKRIFKDTVKINQYFLDDDPENPARAYSRGILYYKYSPEQQDYKKAIYWFTLTKKWSIETEDDHLLNEAYTYLAHSYFHLEKWKQSLENFEKIDPEYLVKDEEEDYPEEFWLRTVKQMMSVCREKCPDNS